MGKVEVRGVCDSPTLQHTHVARTCIRRCAGLILVFGADISSLNESVGDSAFSHWLAEHSFANCSNLMRSLIPLWVIPQGNKIFENSNLAGLIHDCSPRREEIHICTLPLHVSSTGTKKGHCSLITWCADWHCPLAPTACWCVCCPPCTALPSHVWNQNKPDSAARMNKVPDVKENERRTPQTDTHWSTRRKLRKHFFLRAKVQWDRWDCVDKRTDKLHKMPYIQRPVRGFAGLPI